MAIYENIEFAVIQPDCCNVPFLMSVYWIKARKNDHKNFYCPNCGGSRWYPPGSSEKEKLEARLKQETRMRLDAEGRAHKAEKLAEAERKVAEHRFGRIMNGVCPCCNRYFENLHKHMQTKHKNAVPRTARIKLLRNQQKLRQYELENLIGVPRGYLSLYENENESLPAWAQANIDKWVDENL